VAFHAAQIADPDGPAARLSPHFRPFAGRNWAMAQNFLTCDRDQPMLLPLDLRDWLDEDHLAWFVIEAIDELDLEPFYGAYRSDGHGRAAHEPKMMVTLLAYAYAIGERSSRGIERRCREDVAFRVITPNQAPDHATIARFGPATKRRSGICSAGCSVSAPRRAWSRRA
jgi:transposase